MRYQVTPFIAGLPKTELHLHLVGSASIETVLGLARRHPDAGVPTEREALARFYQFTDFPHFIQNYALVDAMVTTASDVHDLVLGLAGDAARSNVRYAEVTVTPSMHLAKGVSAADLAAALTESRQAALEQTGIELNWIFDIPAGFGEEHVTSCVDFAVRHRPEGTVALGLAGLEADFPRAHYAEHFDLAVREGLHSVVHAGETTGPGEVWDAIRLLHAERIGHGISSAADPALLEHLREHGITLEVCPTSNICTRAVELIEAHPLPRLLNSAAPVTLSTDDPGMFATDLNNEYALAAEVFGLSDAELARLASTGVRAAFCSEELRAALLAEISQAVPAGRRPAR